MALSNITAPTRAAAAGKSLGRTALGLLLVTAALGWRAGRMGAISRAVREAAASDHG